MELIVVFIYVKLYSKKTDFRGWDSKKMDESGVEPETFRMLSERATNYATRPNRYRFWALE